VIKLQYIHIVRLIYRTPRGSSKQLR